MSLPPDTRVLPVLRAAAQSVMGGLLLWALTCAFADAIATAATAGPHDEFNWSWAFSWIGHLALAGFGLWGLVVIAIHACCVSALIQGTERILCVVAIIFSAQLTTSTIIASILDSEHWMRAVAICLPLIAGAMTYAIWSLVRQKTDRD